MWNKQNGCNGLQQVESWGKVDAFNIIDNFKGT